MIFIILMDPSKIIKSELRYGTSEFVVFVKLFIDT